MPITPTYPGVYIEELPSLVHTIAGVATSITAFVGYTSRGIDNRAELLLSFSDYERLFGGIAADSELSYTVQQFFANGGSQAYVVRAPRGGSLITAQMQDGVSLSFTLAPPGDHWVANSLAVLAAVEAVGGDLASAGLALAERFSYVRLPGGRT